MTTPTPAPEGASAVTDTKVARIGELERDLAAAVEERDALRKGKETWKQTAERLEDKYIALLAKLKGTEK